MNEKLKYYLRWISVLPGALIAGFLSTFLLHWALYFTLAHGKIVSGVNIAPIEYTFYPFVIALTFIFSGYKIAPKYKLKTAFVLFVIYIITWSTISFIALSKSGFYNIDMQFSVRTILALLGALIGLYIVKKINVRENGNSH